MSKGLSAFVTTVQTTHAWINDLMALMSWQDSHRGYQTLRAVLHALRDRLSVEEAAALGAQLPMLVRGFYYEGWHPHGKPVKDRKEDAFLVHVQEGLRQDPDPDPEQVVRAVFQLLANHISRGEIAKLKHVLPAELRSLWPEEIRSLSL